MNAQHAAEQAFDDHRKVDQRTNTEASSFPADAICEFSPAVFIVQGIGDQNRSFGLKQPTPDWILETNFQRSEASATFCYVFVFDHRDRILRVIKMEIDTGCRQGVAEFPRC